MPNSNRDTSMFSSRRATPRTRPSLRRALSCVALALATYAPAGAQNADAYAVRVSATATASPPRLTFTWIQDVTATGYEVRRRPGPGQTWGTAVASLVGTASTWIDSTVAVGQAYEYWFAKSAPGYSGDGYIYAGIELPATEQRGTVLLIADNTYTSVLAPELRRLQADLVGDGWEIVRQDVSPSQTVSEIKAIIVQARQSHPTLAAVFLFGAIARPYSGDIAPDGHPEHLGAWPADVYYGEFDGPWTDNSVNSTSGTSAANNNVPGDGKFDQSSIPSDVDVAVGRVDGAGMQTFCTIVPTLVTFNDLMRRYLDKDHAFRHGLVAAPRRGLIDDNFGGFSGEAFAASAWRDFSAMLSSTMAHPRDWVTTLDTASYLWAYGCGPGSGSSASGVATTTDFRNTQVRAVFTALFGSWFGDWATDGNLLRAPLFSRPSALVCFWSGRPHWHVHHMGLGQTIGYSTRLSQNNSTDYVASSSPRGVHIALMGDPTLRLHPVLPPGSVVATSVGAGRVRLSWDASPDSVRGYRVYRAGSLSLPFTRLTATELTTTSYEDSVAPASNCVYMVRASKLEVSGSGTYVNLSQGVFDSVSVSLGAAYVSAARAQRLVRMAGRVVQLTLGEAGPVAIEVQTLSGQIVLRKATRGRSRASVDLSGLAAGVYLLSVAGSGAATLSVPVALR